MSVELDRPLRAAEMKLELSMPILMPLSASKSGWEDSVATVSVQARASQIKVTVKASIPTRQVTVKLSPRQSFHEVSC